MAKYRMKNRTPSATCTLSFRLNGRQHSIGLTPKDIVEGEHFERFVPEYLELVPEVKAAPAPAPKVEEPKEEPKPMESEPEAEEKHAKRRGR